MREMWPATLEAAPATGTQPGSSLAGSTASTIGIGAAVRDRREKEQSGALFVGLQIGTIRRRQATPTLCEMWQVA